MFHHPVLRLRPDTNRVMVSSDGSSKGCRGSHYGAARVNLPQRIASVLKCARETDKHGAQTGGTGIHQLMNRFFRGWKNNPPSPPNQALPGDPVLPRPPEPIFINPALEAFDKSPLLSDGSGV